MTEEQKSPEELAAEFRALGENLAALLRATWESPETQKVRREIESRLAEVTAAIGRASAEFRSSPTGQKIQSEFDEVRQKVRTSGAKETARSELLAALQKLNAELAKARAKAESPGEDSPSS